MNFGPINFDLNYLQEKNILEIKITLTQNKYTK